LIRSLRRHGYDTESANTGKEVLSSFHRADLVLLGLEMPDVDGLEVCRRIREVSDTPIIAIADHGTELDRVLGLQAGSDDCLNKPYGVRELMARIEAVMRRARPEKPTPQRILRGSLVVDSRMRVVRVGGRVIKVTRKEFDLLHILASQPETVVSRGQLMSQVWDDGWSGTSRTIDTHVSSLRAKLGDSNWIVTVRGVGFRLGRGAA